MTTSSEWHEQRERYEDRIANLRDIAAVREDALEKLHAKVKRLEGERDQLVADARRYRWLNDARRSHIQEWMDCDTEREANAYIDAMLAKEEERC